MFRHGKETQVAVGGYNISAYLNQADAVMNIDTAETSHFGSQAKTYITGEDDGTFSFKGLFDGSVGGIDEVSDAILGYNIAEAIIPVILADDGGFATGRRAKLGLSKVTGWEVDAPVADVVSVSGDFQATKGIKHGVMLSGITASPLGVSNGSTVDGVSASAGPLMVFAAVVNSSDGTAQTTVQHSDDGTTWIDFAVLPSVALHTSQGLYLEQAGGTKRYLRTHTTLAGATGSAQVIVAVARS